MKNFIAERELLYSLKDSDRRSNFVIRIYAPFIVDEDKVDFLVGEGLEGCRIETHGLPEEFYHEVYGVDGIQAINIASNIEPYLKRLEKKYDLFWLSGEPYFDD